MYTFLIVIGVILAYLFVSALPSMLMFFLLWLGSVGIVIAVSKSVEPSIKSHIGIWLHSTLSLIACFLIPIIALWTVFPGLMLFITVVAIIFYIIMTGWVLATK